MSVRTAHFILHVPRSAGTTVERHFARHLGDGFCLPPRWNNPLRHVIGNRYPGLSPDDLADVTVASGHSLSTGFRHLFPGARIREYLLLRDPVSRFVSLYNLRCTRHREGLGPEPPGFEAWYRGQRLNPITRFLLNRYFEFGVPELYRLSSAGRLAWLERRLAGFAYVGAWRNVGEVVGAISAELGIPEVPERFGRTEVAVLSPDMLPERLRHRIIRDNRLDQILFDRWHERGWDLRALPASPSLPAMDQPLHVWADTLSGLRKSLPGGV